MKGHIVLNKLWAFFRVLRQKEAIWSKCGNLCLFLFFSKSILINISLSICTLTFSNQTCSCFFQDYAMKKTPLEDKHWLTTQLSKTEHKFNYCTDISRPPRQKRDNWQKKEKSIKWLQKRLGARQSWGKRWFKFWTFFSYTKQIAYILFIMPNDTTECDTEIESKNAALFKRYGNLDQVFFVHTSISIRDHERIFSNFCIKW